jgi:predicted metal-dependent hydrolase
MKWELAGSALVCPPRDIFNDLNLRKFDEHLFSYYTVMYGEGSTMPSFQYGNTIIDYTLEYQENKKDITISVEWMEGVTVIAPPDISDEDLEGVLYKKAPWILEKWYRFEEISQTPSPKEFVSGEKFSYLGRHYRLKVNKSADTQTPSLSFQHGRFIADIPSGFTDTERREHLYKLFKHWYIRNGQSRIKERIKIYCPRLGVTPAKFELKDQKMRWGSCTNEGAIYVNWRIVMAPMSVIDYVVVHELAHLIHPNHSADYWQVVRSIMPDYEQRKEWLRINGPKLQL